jgi:hypothetical protein
MATKTNLILFVGVVVLLFSGMDIISLPGKRKAEVVLKPEGSSLMTEIIQKAIDSCEKSGGGIVRFLKGTYYSGTILLKSNVTLQLDKGVLIKGSDKYPDYRNDAFLYGRDLTGISIIGEGIIDGVDCYNPKGEEGFRGPHCIRLINCKRIKLEGFTIKNSANWAVNCRHCSEGNVINVTILGGHDGLHTRFCDHFTVTGCDFRTGDDAFAGNDNKDFLITSCSINTSCNGFRMGCLNLTVQKCRLWGPGEYMHKIQKRNNMLSAFVHFSPKDENPVLQSGNWIIKEVTVENVDQFYMYNFRNGLWQTGQPVSSVNFENVKASGLLGAFYIEGDTGRLFKLRILNSSFAVRENTQIRSEKFEGAKLQSSEFFHAEKFDRISLERVTFIKHEESPLISFESGNEIIIKRLTCKTGSDSPPYTYSNIINLKTDQPE